MAKVFLSYSRHSRTIVDSLAADIRTLQHDVWFDEALSGGQEWWSAVLAAIRESSIFVYVLDRLSINSTACRREYSYANSLKKNILPVLVEAELSATMIPSYLTQLHMSSYRHADHSTALALARALNAFEGARPLPDPLPKEPPLPLSYLGDLAERLRKTEALSYEEQATLFLDLRRVGRERGTQRDALELLGILRKREELLASVAENIDEFLASISEPLPTRAETLADDSHARTATDPHSSDPGRGMAPRKDDRVLYRLRQPVIALTLAAPSSLLLPLLLARGDGIDGYSDDMWEFSSLVLGIAAFAGCSSIFSLRRFWLALTTSAIAIVLALLLGFDADFGSRVTLIDGELSRKRVEYGVSEYMALTAAAIGGAVGGRALAGILRSYKLFYLLMAVPLVIFALITGDGLDGVFDDISEYLALSLASLVLATLFQALLGVLSRKASRRY